MSYIKFGTRVDNGVPEDETSSEIEDVGPGDGLW